MASQDGRIPPPTTLTSITPELRRDPSANLGSVGEDEALVARIRTEIERDGPMTFARFMSLALYDPDGGYYRGPVARPGREGDFLTAPEAHPIFGRALAGFVSDAWRRLGRPATFVVREYGAGTGTLALAILDALRADEPDLVAVIRYDPIEVEPARIEAIDARLAQAGHRRAGPERVNGEPTAPDTATPMVGVVIANEVLDALPTHRVVARGGWLREVMVGWEDGRFVDIEADPSTPALEARLTAEDIAMADGQRAEICLELDGWMARAAAGLDRGILLIIDYGYPAAELYDPVRRRDGTLRAYLRHTVHDDPYIHVGRQDLTAHIDVTAVETAARAAGLDHLGTTTQGEFLAGLGAGEALQQLGTDPATTMEDYLTARSALLRMIDPAAMGRFRVLAFGRRWPDGPQPAGFAFRTPR